MHFALVAILCAQPVRAYKPAHAFEGSPKKAITFPNAGSYSQIHYFKPGKRAFSMKCPAPAHAFYEIHVPGGNIGSSRAIKYTAPKSAEQHLTVSSPSIVTSHNQSNTTWFIDGCPLKRHRRPWEAVELETVLQYGHHPCDAATPVVQFEIESAGPYAITVGEEVQRPFTDYLSGPIVHERAGNWAGWQSPWLLVLIALKAALVVKALGGNQVQWDVVTHSWIIATLLIFMLAEESRVSGIMKYTLDRTCPSPDEWVNATGSRFDHHDPSILNRQAVWVATARLVLYITLVWLVIYHHWHRTQPVPIILLSVLTGLLSWAFAVAGGGFAVLIIIYVIAEGLATKNQGSASKYFVLTLQ